MCLYLFDSLFHPVKTFTIDFHSTGAFTAWLDVTSGGLINGSTTSGLGNALSTPALGSTSTLHIACGPLAPQAPLGKL